MKRKRKRQQIQEMMFGLPPMESDGLPSNEPLTFVFRASPFRVIKVGNESRWALADVARQLGYRDAPNASRILKDKHKGTHLVSTLGGTQLLTTINEAGLYRLMMRSNHPEAEAFQDWVEEDVLPAIRKTGTYALPAGRAGRECARLNCDVATGVLRAESFAVNKDAHRQLAMDGACPLQFRGLHDGGYIILSGKDTMALREELEIGRRQTPQDKFTAATLPMKYLPMEILGKVIEDAIQPISVDEQIEMVHRYTRELKEKILDLYGPGSRVAVRSDAARGKVLDVIPAPRPISAS